VKTYFIITFFLFIAILFSQVNFEYDFSFDRINPDDEYVNIWIDDLNEDGTDEIYASCRYSNDIDSINVWGIVTYDLNGEIVSNFEQSHPDNKIILKCAILKNQDSTYLISAFRRNEEDGWTTYSNLDIEIYDFYTLDLIDNISLDIGSYGWESGSSLSNVNYIKPIIIQDILTMNVGITKYSFFYDQFDGTQIYTTKLKKFSFDNETLQFIESIDNCGRSLIIYNGFDYLISSGYRSNQSSYGMGQASSSTRKYYIKLLTLENPSEVIEILYLQGSASSDMGSSSFNNYPTSFTILNNNDENYLESGLATYYRLKDDDSGIQYVFRNYSPDFSDTLWTDLNTYSIEGRITARTCISVNSENHYIMYFNDNQLEIRDRTNGNIIHYQNSSINPFSIQRKSDEELLFITNNDEETGYDVYMLNGEIQVSAEENQISTPSFELQNYPNPFNPSTTIEFSIQNDSQIDLTIFNIKGQKVKQLFSDQQTAGQYSIIWNGDNESGEYVSSGIYCYQLKIDGKTEAVKKCLLLK
jgi:hypothetical protein